MEEYVQAVAFEIEELNTSASNSNMADLSQPTPSDPSKHCLELIYRLDALRKKDTTVKMLPRHPGSACRVLDGCIYALCGSTIILYKLDEGSCKAVADPPTGRYGACLVSDKRHLYLVGGFDLGESQEFKTVERFDPILATWEEIAAMNEGRWNAFGAAMNGKIYIAGGINESGGLRRVLKSCEVYDPSTNEWQVLSNLKVCRQAANMVCFQEALYVVGGFIDLKVSLRELSAEVLQLGACEWKSKSTIPTNFENENPGDRKKKIHHKACLAVIHKSLLEKLCRL
ncbi:kelch-like protein 3 [Montipora capricornis]|uniref:kelch-like protein 3 n=1 Tax=Montipora capricornis TaxID=246305 RepID=UPI0035F1AB23